MNIANKVTVLRILLIPIFLIIYFDAFNIFKDYSHYYSTAIFIFASLTDALDGYLARSKNLITNFGKFADPLADKLLVLSALVSLVYTNNLDPIIVIIILSREFIITGFRIIAIEKNIVIDASIYGKLKTVSQMIMIPYFLLNLNNSSNQILILIGYLLVAVTTLLTVVSAFDYIYKNKNVLKDI